MKMHKNNLVKRGFAVLLALALCVGMMPFTAVAADDHEHVYQRTCETHVNCTLSHVDVYSCTHPGCRESYRDSLSTHGHDVLGYVNKAGGNLVDNTHWIKCANCNDAYESHEMSDATCMAPKTCYKCNYTKGEKLGHAYTGAWVKVEGGHARLCVNGCGGHEELQAHTFGEWVIDPDATCGLDGKQTRTCTVCGFVETQDIPATGNHNWGVWAIEREATCIVPGSKWHACAVCGTRETEAIPVNPNAHNFDGAYVEATTATGGLGHAQKCQNEGCTKLSMVTPHKLTTTTNDAACGKPGSVVEKCTVCSYTSTKVLPELKHKWTIHDKKAPTCIKDGFDNVYCQYCGMKSATASKIIPSEGHKYNDWQVDVLGYLTHSHTCEVCGEKETSEHNFTEWTVTSEDEVSKVESRVCEDCGYKETKTTSKVCRHPGTEQRNEHQDATCVTAGYDVTICGVCDAEVERHDIPALGHTYGAWTDNGEENHIHTCVNEGCTAGTEGHAVTAAHNFGEWVTTAYPTYGIPGQQERTCDGCARVETEMIPALVGPPVIPPPVVVPEEPDEPIEEPDVPLDPAPEEPDEPIEEPDVPLNPAPEEPDEPIEEPDVPLDPTPEEPDEPIEEPDVPLDPTPDEPVDEPDVPLNPAPEEPAGGNGNGGSGANDEEILEDGEIPLADVPKTSDDLSLLWILVLACGATLMARCLSRKERTQR
ncbi:hypothetical protein AALA61_00740 [Oscillospiraceae bacterium 42-9]